MYMYTMRDTNLLKSGRVCVRVRPPQGGII